MNYSNWQLPPPHWGRPHPPAGAGAHSGSDDREALWAAGTLRCFSTSGVRQVGQSGVSWPRIKSSNSESHERQRYS